MWTAHRYIELDECINCYEEIGATGTHTFYNGAYDGQRGIIVCKSLEYMWTHILTQQPKCNNDSGLYAASNKRPQQ